MPTFSFVWRQPTGVCRKVERSCSTTFVTSRRATNRANALGFPTGNQVFGVVPRTEPQPGRIPIPLDQMLRNLATTYESALTMEVLRHRRFSVDLENLRWLANAFDHALHHDNSGLPLPVAADGSGGLHNGYEDGDLALFSNQTQGAGRAGEIRLAGFSAGAMCSASGYCLVLDGATGGNNAFAILGLLCAWAEFGKPQYLEDARIIGRWIVGNLKDTSPNSFGGCFQGYPDGGRPRELMHGKSIENDADIFAALSLLATAEELAGQHQSATAWRDHANHAGDFVMRMFELHAGKFHAGTVPSARLRGLEFNPMVLSAVRKSPTRSIFCLQTHSPCLPWLALISTKIRSTGANQSSMSDITSPSKSWPADDTIPALA